MTHTKIICAKSRTETCPSCGGLESSFYMGPRVDEPSNLMDLWGKETGDRFFFDFFRCGDCGLLFNKRYPKENDLNKLYSLLADNVISGDDYCHEKTQQWYNNTIVKHVGKKSVRSILEVGPDLGILSCALIKSFDVKKYVCVEPNTSMHQRLLSIDGVSKVYSTIHDAKSANEGEFDLIVFVHVLDHLRDPLHDLQCASAMLNEGGSVFSVTHNYSSILRHLMGRKWPPFCMYHPHLFNIRSKATLFDQANLKPMAFGRTMNYFPLSFYLKHALGVVGISKSPNFPGNLALPLGNIYMIGEKSG